MEDASAPVLKAAHRRVSAKAKRMRFVIIVLQRWWSGYWPDSQHSRWMSAAHNYLLILVRAFRLSCCLNTRLQSKFRGDGENFFSESAAEDSELAPFFKRKDGVLLGGDGRAVAGCRLEA